MLLTETVLFLADCLDFIRQQDNNVSSTREVKNWAKSIKSNVIKSLPSQPSSISAAHLTKSISSSTRSGIWAPQTTPATTCLSTSTSDALSSASLDGGPHIQGSNETECVAIKNSNSHWAKVRFSHILSTSDPNALIDYGSRSCQWIQAQRMGFASSHHPTNSQKTCQEAKTVE